MRPGGALAARVGSAQVPLNTYLVVQLEAPVSTVLISTKGQIVLPIAVRKALGLKPGMRVSVKVQGKKALLTPAPAKKVVSLRKIRSLLPYEGPVVPLSDMRVTAYKG